MKQLMAQYKKERRNTRLLRIYILSESYFKYQQFYLNQCFSNHATSYNQAESTSMFINTFFKGETTPADFIRTQDDANNELIETHQDYQSFINNTFLDANVIDAFCKASEHSFNTMLKINSSIFAKQIGALALYNIGQITKKEAEEQMVDFCIFSKKTKKLNKRLFKKTIHTIEKLYNEILTKKTLRQINKL